MNNEDGNLTLLAAGIISVVVSLVFILLGMVLPTLHTHQAQVAADQAAIAAATALALGEAEPCTLAAEVAAEHDTALDQCEVVALDVVVSVRKGVSQARARAGPV